nr:hypothetical protein [Bradyrhizobium sp. NBAIM32]
MILRGGLAIPDRSLGEIDGYAASLIIDIAERELGRCKLLIGRRVISTKCSSEVLRAPLPFAVEMECPTALKPEGLLDE